MPLPDIQLDDRSYEQLKAELLRRIPAYTPEWTDHNATDPGITLLQMVAWLSETIIWRLNKVPGKNYQAFLQLLGIDLNPAAPARTELTFKLTAKEMAIPIPAGTQVQLASAPGGGPVIFGTDDDIQGVGIALKQVQVFDGARYTAIPADQLQPGKSFAALSDQPQANAALYLGFDGVFPTGRHRLTIHAAPPGNAPIVQAGLDLAGSTLPPVIGHWEYNAGGVPGWQPLAVASDTTNCLTQSGIVAFDATGNHVSTKLGAQRRPEDSPLCWIRFRIDQLLGRGYESTPLLEDILLNTVSATNAVEEIDELLGASSGLPNQTFNLANVPVLPKDPTVPGIIAVQESLSGPFLTWTEVANFGKSGRDDLHYTINHATGLVAFGDGTNGKIPSFVSRDGSNRFDSDVPNIKVLRYRWGGGAAGNAGPNTITTLNTIIPYVDSVTNVRSSWGGRDEETVADAGDRAPGILRSRNRAVTAEDFAEIAKQTPGTRIVRAQALPLFHPTLSVARAPTTPGVAYSKPAHVPFPGVVTVLVIPDSTNSMPVPSAATLQLVADWLNSHRLVATEVHVKGPDYRKVEIQVSVIADPRSLIATVSQALRAQLLAYFNPVTGGAEGAGWDFGAPIYFSETIREILITPGVLRIVSGTFQTYVDDVLQDGDLSLSPGEIAYSIEHRITVTYT